MFSTPANMASHEPDTWEAASNHTPSLCEIIDVSQLFPYIDNVFLLYCRQGGSAASSSLRSGQGSAILQVPTGDEVRSLDLAHAAGASSYAPG